MTDLFNPLSIEVGMMLGSKLSFWARVGEAVMIICFFQHLIGKKRRGVIGIYRDMGYFIKGMDPRMKGYAF